MQASDLTSGDQTARDARVDWGVVAERGVRTLAAVTMAAVSLSVLIGGVGGRLAMAFLAGLNPENDGAISDDGFVIGRFDVGGTAQLLAFSVQVGLLAAVCYLVLRHLLLGPRWFQVVSMAVGAGVVVGAVIVHPDGIDFTAFDPPALPIALFVLLPIVYVAALAVLAERFLHADWFTTTDPRLLGALTFVVWGLGSVLLVLLLVTVAVWALWQLVSGTAVGAVVRSPVTLWIARALLSILFVAAVTNLVDDISALT